MREEQRPCAGSDLDQGASVHAESRGGPSSASDHFRYLPIHNHKSERVLRIIALQAKNALFVGHKEGCEES
jgi:hypothetical protein